MATGRDSRGDDMLERVDSGISSVAWADDAEGGSGGEGVVALVARVDQAD